MLYYVIPPIIMVASLALLVFFIGRKMNQIPEIPVIKQEDGTLVKQPGIKEAMSHKISHAFLHAMEKITKRFKLISLKSHNALEGLSKNIKEKKEERLRRREELKKQREEALSALQEGEPSMAAGASNDSEKIISPRKQKSQIKKASQEFQVEPMVKKEATHPEPKIDQKSEYEKEMIKRIAVNPRDIEAYERLGDYYVEQGNGPDAIECFKQVLKLSPGNRKAKMVIRKLDGRNV